MNIDENKAKIQEVVISRSGKADVLCIDYVAFE
jgi:hypothetical protein